MGLYDLNQSVINAIASKKLLDRQYNQAQTEVKKWQLIAERALKKGREDLAREALIRKIAHSKTVNDLKIEIERLTVIINKLKPHLPTLENTRISNPIGSFEQKPEKIGQIEIEIVAAQPKCLEDAIRETQEAVRSALASKERIQQQYDKARKLEQEKFQSQLAATLKTQLEEQEATVKLLGRNLTALENVRDMLAKAKIEDEWEQEFEKTLKAQLLNPSSVDGTSPLNSPSHEVIDAEFE